MIKPLINLHNIHCSRGVLLEGALHGHFARENAHCSVYDAQVLHAIGGVVGERGRTLHVGVVVGNLTQGYLILGRIWILL